MDNNIKWDETFSVKIESLDNEHKKIFELVNRLNRAIPSNDPLEIEDVYTELLDYSLCHFFHEEELMEKYQYPFIKEHIKEHERFKEVILKLKRDKNHIELVIFLYDWLLTHIMNEDKKYTSYIIVM